MALFMDSYQVLGDQQSQRLFNVVLTVSQVCGAAALLSVAAWMGGFSEGGFAWSENPDIEFHYHPTFMTMGLIFIYGESIIVYRVFRNERKRFTKLLHLTLHSMALIFMGVALKAVWDSHDLHLGKDGKVDPLPNLYSMHSWIGILVVVLFSLQYAVGFGSFFFPGASIPMRQFIMPFHQLFGVVIFIMVCCTALMGITERAAWKHTCWTKDKQMCGQQMLSNFFGLFILGYCGSIVLIVMNPRWKRRPLPEEESLHRISTD
ncbi:hypothetical protein L596_025120 [Steinernema carpocapsae]|uniref:Cytochrome b561 domain-containing protein n=1 Tax=Steinernema carpocapsae TaxID=34508 RepID=A0A4U5M716_STECR|nr:hypothetical protein L596_025120 [Steinernema carpocapsae]